MDIARSPTLRLHLRLLRGQVPVMAEELRRCVRCGAEVPPEIEAQLPDDTGLCGDCWNDDRS